MPQAVKFIVELLGEQVAPTDLDAVTQPPDWKQLIVGHEAGIAGKEPLVRPVYRDSSYRDLADSSVGNGLAMLVYNSDPHVGDGRAAPDEGRSAIGRSSRGPHAPQRYAGDGQRRFGKSIRRQQGMAGKTNGFEQVTKGAQRGRVHELRADDERFDS